MKASERVRILLVDGGIVEINTATSRREMLLSRLGAEHALVRAVGELLADYLEQVEQEGRDD